MFQKIGSIEFLTPVNDLDGIKKWKPGFCDDCKYIGLPEEFKTADDKHERILYEPDKYVYFRSRAITADVPNGNGDLFLSSNLKECYKTFIGKPLFIEHNSKDIDNRIGKIFSAKWVEGTGKDGKPDKYIETLCGVDVIRSPEYAQFVREGNTKGKTVSMGCTVAKCTCSVCSKSYTTSSAICPHMDFTSPFFVKGQKYNGQVNMAFPIIPENPIIYEINEDVIFNELSLVEFPADPNAHVFEIWAHLNKDLGLSKDQANFYLDVLIDFLKGNTEKYLKLGTVELNEFGKILTELKLYFSKKEQGKD